MSSHPRPPARPPDQPAPEITGDEVESVLDLVQLRRQYPCLDAALDIERDRLAHLYRYR